MKLPLGSFVPPPESPHVFGGVILLSPSVPPPLVMAGDQAAAHHYCTVCNDHRTAKTRSATAASRTTNGAAGMASKAGEVERTFAPTIPRSKTVYFLQSLSKTFDETG